MRYVLAMLLCGIACALRAEPFLTVSSLTTNLVLSASDFAALHHVTV